MIHMQLLNMMILQRRLGDYMNMYILSKIICMQYLMGKNL